MTGAPSQYFIDATEDSELLLIDAYHVAAQAALGDERAVSSDVAGTLEELARWKPLRKERVPDRSDVFVRESGSRFEVAPENIEARHLEWGSRIPAGRAVQKAIFTAN